MADYYIEWSIDLEADSPRDAARKALEIMRDPRAIATCFKVYDEDGNPVDVDLETEDQPQGVAPRLF